MGLFPCKCAFSACCASDDGADVGNFLASGSSGGVVGGSGWERGNSSGGGSGSGSSPGSSYRKMEDEERRGSSSPGSMLAKGGKSASLSSSSGAASSSVSPARARAHHRSKAKDIVDDEKRTTAGAPVYTPALLPASVEDERRYMRNSFDSGAFKDDSQEPRECVVCYETFTLENPQVRTLCGCGVNKRAFHLSCLMQWREHSKETACPVCREELYYDD